ncbi:MAG: hypothetical protein ABIU95_16740 [Burkholderiales bacterium]
MTTSDRKRGDSNWRTRLSHFTRALRAAAAGPFWAAMPLAALAFTAFLGGYPSAAWFVEVAFGLLLLAWPGALLVGVPLHFVLARLGSRGTILRAIAGVALAVGIAWTMPVSEDDEEPPEPWTGLQWATLAAYGLVAGTFFARSARRT